MATNRNFTTKTKVARVPAHWNVQEINEGLEYLASLMDQYQDELSEAKARSQKGVLSNRYEKLAEKLEEMAGMFPRTWAAPEGSED